MVERITLDFSRFEARVHDIESRMLSMEAFMGVSLAAVFKNEVIMTALVKEIGEEKARKTIEGVIGYLTLLNARHGDGG